MDEYISGLPEKARKRKFILECQRSEKGAISANDIHQSIQRMEESKSLRSSKSVFRNVLSVVVRVMKDYDSVIQTLGMSLGLDLNHGIEEDNMLSPKHLLIPCPLRSYGVY